MRDEPRNEPQDTPLAGQVDTGPSTELALRAPATVENARRWPDVVVRARRQLVGLRQNPAAMVTVSAVATVGSAVLTAGLRRGLRGTLRAPAGRAASVAVRGHLVHEVHVIHHVVHHVVRRPAD